MVLRLTIPHKFIISCTPIYSLLITEINFSTWAVLGRYLGGTWAALGRSNSFSEVHSAIKVAFRMKASAWNDGIAQPFVSNSLQIRSIPSPNSLTYLYALRYWAIFGLREKCVWWIFYGAPISCLRVKLLKIIGINADMLKNKNKREKMMN